MSGIQNNMLTFIIFSDLIKYTYEYSFICLMRKVIHIILSRTFKVVKLFIMYFPIYNKS